MSFVNHYVRRRREVSSNDLLNNNSCDDYNALKFEYDVLTSELTEYWAQYEQTRKELWWVREDAVVERHRVSGMLLAHYRDQKASL